MATTPINSTIQAQIVALEEILIEIRKAKTLTQKNASLDTLPLMKAFLPLLNQLQVMFSLETSDVFLLKSVAAIGQATIAFGTEKDFPLDAEAFQVFLSMLRSLENSYSTIGGVIGYHLAVLKLICAKQAASNEGPSISYGEPEGLDLSKDVHEMHQAVRWGIESVGKVAEIYPIGGAGDRLNLKDEKTGELLPAAQLQFCGQTLLQGMIRDLQAREFLHYRLFGVQQITPVAMMTSHEKKNHQHVIAICEQHGWFGRAAENFKFFIQPLVPVVTIEGYWAMHGPLHPILKPGGHGVIWKTAMDAGVFDWLDEYGCHKMLIRQINNPVAGVDNGLLTLAGLGCGGNKRFGFASCSRVLNTAEGMNVVKGKKVVKGSSEVYEYGITNIEYVDFASQGIQDVPVCKGSPFSRFPSNTNILFADLAAVRQAVAICPIPGMLINMKSKVICQGSRGKVTIEAGRLESIMQNIADYIVDQFPHPLKKGEFANLSTFLTYNERCKTISVTKQAYEAGGQLLGTPEGCYYDVLKNYRNLLADFCKMKLPALESEAVYLETGPSFIALFHPALGPLYEVIGQKIRGGRLAIGAEWLMEVAEVDIENLDLDGSLLIDADAIMGKEDTSGFCVYESENCGKCSLYNVVIKNKGINRKHPNVYWKQAVERVESVRIILHGNAEFSARDVILEGNHVFEVPDGHRMEVFSENNTVKSRLESIEQATWVWDYTFGADNKIVLKLNFK